MIWTVQAFASSDVFAEYQKSIGFDRETAIGEVVCMWGDDLYHPTAPQMNKLFSPAELTAMADFDKVFRKHQGQWQKHWTEIQESARQLLRTCGWKEK